MEQSSSCVVLNTTEYVLYCIFNLMHQVAIAFLPIFTLAARVGSCGSVCESVRVRVRAGVHVMVCAGVCVGLCVGVSMRIDKRMTRTIKFHLLKAHSASVHSVIEVRLTVRWASSMKCNGW